MFRIFHKAKPLANYILAKVGLYLFFHKTVVKLFSKREKLSRKYIHGEGIEVGALHTPLAIFNKAKVIYVDRLDNKGLLKHYPELNHSKFVKVGLVDDGERLAKVKQESQNFIIANHFIEHCENPIKTLTNHLRVLRKGGIIYWAIPDKRYTFDSVRKTTTTAHVIEDYRRGTLYSRRDHYDEWAKVILRLEGAAAKEKSTQLMKELYSIHFHTYTKETFEKLLYYAKKELKIPFQIVEIVPNINEFVVIIQKI
jgi:ubiquinone/menaquinone biosynthesis C-methylase UbiE